MSERKLSYATDIKPLFTSVDREHMLFMFDLWSYDEVKANAADIYDAVSKGRMPPEEPWPQEQSDAFKAWMDQGSAP